MAAVKSGSNEPKHIHVLPQEVVNRIAAGEVIVRPANAIKEMLENCIDAGATSVRVVLKDGGLKSIQITDNGCGIRKDDLPIVCERFTTSKLSSFEDLQSLSTFGFRGEALASISHVAHVTIVSMTRDSPCAYKAHYADGKLVGRDGDTPDPKPCAGTVGTTITCEDLFFNVPSRRKAMKSASEEYQRVADVVGKYALHYSGIAINLKKHGDNRSDVNTVRGASLKDNIRLLHGSKVHAELLELNVAMESLNLTVKGFVTGPNYNVSKKTTFILFINNRLVDCAPLKKAIDMVYANMFQRSVHPWIYLSLMFPPNKIDQNVHPTKSEVRFLNQDEVIAEVVAHVTQELEKANMMRTFDTEGGAAWSVVPHQVQTSLHDSMEVDASSNPSSTTPEKRPSPAKPYQHQMIRTDSKSQKLDGFLSPNKARVAALDVLSLSPIPFSLNAEPVPTANDEIELEDDDPMHVDQQSTLIEEPNPANMTDPSALSPTVQTEVLDDFEEEIETIQPVSPTRKTTKDESRDFRHDHGACHHVSSSTTRDEALEPPSKLRKFAAGAAPESSPVRSDAPEEFRKRKRLETRTSEKPRLTSLMNLIRQFEEDSHEGLRSVFSNYTYVGCVDETRALVQFETRLFLCDLCQVSKELAYQECLHRLGELEKFEFKEPLPLHDLVLISLTKGSTSIVDEAVLSRAKDVVSHLVSHAEMLREYFSLDIDPASSTLNSIPQIIDEYPPFMGNLPRFLVDVTTHVNWSSEQPCLDGIARCLADMYALHPKQFPQVDDNCPTQNWIVEHVLLPTLRLRFSPPRQLARDGSVVQITSLEKLYKVFERC